MLRNRQKSSPEQSASSPGASSQQIPAGQTAAPKSRGFALPWGLLNAAPPLFCVGLALEHWAPPAYKPSVVVGGALGSLEAEKLKTELATKQATLASQNEENGRLQKQLALFQAQNERLSEAYKADFQQATTNQQAMAQAQEKVLELEANVAKESQGGNLGGAQVAQIVTAFGILTGDKQVTATGLNASRALTEEATNNIHHQIEQGVQNSVAMSKAVHQGLPGMGMIDAMVAGTENNPAPPADHAPPPAPPEVYQQQPAQQMASLDTPTSAAPTETQPFLDGLRDRHALENWVATLSGDARAGAGFWAGKRNDPKWRRRADCAVGEGGEISDEFRETCEKAKAFLTQVDQRRTTEPDYKRGWNSI
jgi:hypothetical protein